MALPDDPLPMEEQTPVQKLTALKSVFQEATKKAQKRRFGKKVATATNEDYIHAIDEAIGALERGSKESAVSNLLTLKQTFDETVGRVQEMNSNSMMLKFPYEHIQEYSRTLGTIIAKL